MPRRTCELEELKNYWTCTMSRIDELFASLRSQKQKALIPFVTAGVPDLAFTSELLLRLSDLGCAACEIGFPYSDPIADGPVIQDSYTRALQSGIRVSSIFDMAREVSGRTSMPLIAMVSFAIVHRLGMARFVEEAREAGLAGLIIPDLAAEESIELATHCGQANLSLIQLVTPTTSDDRMQTILTVCSGFVYFVSVVGITGERAAVADSTLARVGWLRTQTPLPICVGFGVSGPEQARALAPVADGVIVGSALVRRISEAGSRAEAIRSVETLVHELLSALE